MDRPLPSSRWTQILLLEDNSARAERRQVAGIGAVAASDVVLRLHKISSAGVFIAGESVYSPGNLGELAGAGGRAALALDLLDSLRARRKQCVIVAGPSYGGNRCFTEELLLRGFDWTVELPRSAVVTTDVYTRGVRVTKLLSTATWQPQEVISPTTGKVVTYAVAHLGYVPLSSGTHGRLFVAQTGAIQGVHQGTIFGLSSVAQTGLEDLLCAIGWARWIRPLVRLEERRLLNVPLRQRSPRASSAGLQFRSNIKLTSQQDAVAPWIGAQDHRQRAATRGVLRKESEVLNVLELFAGAGGMGLGFVLAGGREGRFRLGFSGEVHPVYASTLRSNHVALAHICKGRTVVPERIEPLDLRMPKSLRAVEESMRHLGDTHVLIGGPPCQGFSSANRNSCHGANPHNELIDVFLKYVRRLNPRVFVMENVQGILWSPKSGRKDGELSVVKALADRMERSGYLVFPKLLDAVWYGVPQYRSRFFLLGIHRDLGYRQDDFGTWGPYPHPTHGPGTLKKYTTVRDAIGDLPRIGNGHDREKVTYAEPDSLSLSGNPYLRFLRKYTEKRTISDHITSRHAEYVLDRYRQIPSGGNWEDISHTLTNYSDVERTHSNIYRRLTWKEPSITIGHYRKSMLIHPSQDRGLSLREAARLQSFPDWFRFQGTETEEPGGLMHKQQQLANAVCPLVTKSLAEFLLRL